MGGGGREVEKRQKRGEARRKNVDDVLKFKQCQALSLSKSQGHT